MPVEPVTPWYNRCFPVRTAWDKNPYVRHICDVEAKPGGQTLCGKRWSHRAHGPLTLADDGLCPVCLDRMFGRYPVDMTRPVDITLVHYW